MVCECNNIYLCYLCRLLGGQQYYVTLRFMNKAGQDVLVRTSDNNPSKGWKVKKNFMMDITKGTTSAQPVTLAASSVDGKQALTLNGKMEVALKPQVTKGKKEVLVLGTSGEWLNDELQFQFYP